MSTTVRLAAAAAMWTLLGGCAAAPEQQAATQFPARMFPVQAIPARSGALPANPEAKPAAALHLVQGQYFSYALPEGWRVGEDGQFALTLLAADNMAMTVMVGNAGLPPNYPAANFVREKLAALQPQNLQLSTPRQAMPIAGFAQAYEFEVDYAVRGTSYHGRVQCHIAPAYDTAVMAMTAAIAELGQWPSYVSWLPLVAGQVAATNGAAFGMRGIMAQNLNNSTAYAEAARQYRDWSQRNWQQVTDERNASQDRNNTAFRESLGAVQTYVNPYDTRVPLELPTTYKYFWIDPKGSVLGTDDPSANPNDGSTGTWQRVPLRQP